MRTAVAEHAERDGLRGVRRCRMVVPDSDSRCSVQSAVNVNDCACFLNRFASGDPYANCDNSSTPPVLNVLDFSCFLNKFAAGCS